MPCQVIIADDVTGAGDSGVHFSRAGKRTALLLDRAVLSDALSTHEAVSLSSESRFLSPDRAAGAVRAAAEECRRSGASVVFKKVDSTLRGNPGAETEALLAVSGHDAALVCTAMPKTGRTCRDGVLLLHGNPIQDTETGRDPFNPVCSSSVAEVLAVQTGMSVAGLSLDAVRSGGESLRGTVTTLVTSGSRILVADAMTDDDLAALGGLLRDSLRGNGSGLPRLLPVGAGGLAEAFAGPPLLRETPEPQGRMLAVVGSLSSVSLRQVEQAAEHADFFLLELDMERAFDDPAAETARLTAALSGAGNRHLVLRNRVLPRSGQNGGIATESGERAARVFGDIAAVLCREAECSMLYATGGSTAVAVAQALGLSGMTLEREMMPGVVLSSCAPAGMKLRWFVSKAGGFGGPDTIVKLAAGILQPAMD